MAKTNQQKMTDLAAKIAKQVERGAGRGLNSARVFATARVKEAASEPAPRKEVRGAATPYLDKKDKLRFKKGAILYYVATTPATAGAPIRKLSGRGRTSIGSKMLTPRTAGIGANAKAMPSRRWPRGFNYMKYHEEVDLAMPGSGKHQYIAPTIKKWMPQLKKIIGTAARLAVK